MKVSGLRWISVMVLTRLTWAQRVWALPVLTALAPSQNFYEQQGRRTKTMLERALQLVKVVKRWLPTRDIVFVGDGSYAALDFLHACQELGVTFISRLRFDAALYDPAPPPTGKRGRPRKKGERQVTLEARLHDPQTTWQTVVVNWYDGQQRAVEIASGTAVWFHSGKPTVPIRWVLVRDPQGSYEPRALLSTDADRDAAWIVEVFVQRWQVEVTFEEARRHLGVESQRQWSDAAIARTTPILMGLFSWVTYVVERLVRADVPITPRQSRWYVKTRPTFSDALALVRQHLWQAQEFFPTSGENTDMEKIPRAYLALLRQALCFAA